MMSNLMFMISIFFLVNLLNNKMKLIFIQNLFFMQGFLFIFLMLGIKYYNLWMFVYMDFGGDKVSMLMILLSFWIISLMFLSILNFLKYYLNIFIFQMSMLMISLYLFFFSLDLMLFYIFFEVSLIPILMMILGWGVQSERLYAGIYMMMYTVFASLPFLMLLIYMFMNLDFLNFLMFKYNTFILFNNFFIYFIMSFVFLVKLPIYMVHLWLPKAHVEAPIFGSMILAGVLLKLGGYGIIRMFMLNFYMNIYYNLIIMIYVFLGALNISILCIRQIDLKMLIAYSSVVHMGFMLVGLLGFYMMSIKGSVIMMISHGLCSSGLFCLLNFSYKRLNSRNLLFNKGLCQYYMNMSMWWFLFCVMNMAAPPSLNLVAEILLIISIIKFSIIFFFIIFLVSFFSGVYSIYLYSYSQHGLNFYVFNLNFNTIDEYLLMVLHWIPMNFFIMNLNYL